MWGKKIVALCMVLLLSMAVAACSDSASEGKKDEVKTNTVEKESSKGAVAEQTENDTKKENVPSDEELLAVLDANLQAYKDKDLDAYMETIHSDSPVYDTTKLQMATIIDKDLDMELTDMKVEEKDADKAKVSYVQRTVAKKPIPEFKNNELKGHHELRQEDGKWKIFASKADDVTYLDDNGDPVDETSSEGTQADDANAKLDGQYASKIKQIQKNMPMKLEVDQYGEEGNYASGLFTIADGEYEGNQVIIDYMEGAKDDISIKSWIELTRQKYAEQAGKDAFDLKVYDTNKNETMYELVIKEDGNLLKQAQVGRVFFKGKDLYAITFGSIGTAEVPKKVGQDLTKMLKKVK